MPEKPDIDMLSEHLWDMAEHKVRNYLKALEERTGALPEAEFRRQSTELWKLLLEFGAEARLALMNEKVAEPKFADGEEEEDERGPEESELETRMAYHANTIKEFVKNCGDHKGDPDLRAFYHVMHNFLIQVAEELMQATIQPRNAYTRTSAN